MSFDMESTSPQIYALIPEYVSDALHYAWGYNAVKLLVGLAATTLGIHVYRRRARSQRRARWAEAGKDVVVLHQFDRAVSCPNISPFALKLETFLRANHIAYVVDSTKPFGPLGKCPWITMNGEDMPDSSIVIERLSAHFGINMDKAFDEEQLAMARSFQSMLEDRTAWGIFYKRYCLDGMQHVWKEFPKNVRKWAPFVKLLLPMGFSKRAKEQGIGRLEPRQVLSILEKDIRATSAFLGDKVFMLGDEVSLLDFCVFGMVCQLLYVSGPELESLVRDRCVNLVRHCQRIRDLYWSDWDQCLQK